MLTAADKARFVEQFAGARFNQCFAIVTSSMMGDVTRRYSSILRNVHEAEELAQSLFARLVSELKKLRDPMTVEGWVWKCADRHLRAHQKRRRFEIACEVPEEHPEVRSPIHLRQAPSALPSGPSVDFVGRIERLAPLDAAIVAFRTAGWTNARIAELFNVNVEVIKKRYQRAMSDLREG